MTELSRRDVLRAAMIMGVGAGLGGGLGACASSDERSGRPGSVTHWDYWVSQTPWVENELKLFAKANPDITIERTVNAQASFDNVFTLAQRSGNAPDVFFITTDTEPLNQQVEKGWLMPLDEWATSEWIHRFPPYSFAEGRNMFDGKIYSAPFSKPAPGVQLYINNAVFRDAGLMNADGSIQVPKTWDDVSRAADRITQRSGGAVYGLGFGNGSTNLLPWWIDVFVRAAGCPGGAGGMDLRTGTYTQASDRNYLDFLDLFIEWRDKGYFFPTSMSISDEIARSNFEQGKFGMTVGGVWNQPQWTEHGFTDYSLTTLVGPEEERQGFFYSAPGGTLLAINAETTQGDAAWKWFDWWHSEDAGRRWVQDYQQDLSIYPDANDSAKVEFQPFADYVALSELSIGGPQPAVRNSAVSQVVTQPTQPDLAGILAGLFTDQIGDAQTALSELADSLQTNLQAGIDEAAAAGHDVSIDDWRFPDWDITKPYAWEIPEYPG